MYTLQNRYILVRYYFLCRNGIPALSKLILFFFSLISMAAILSACIACVCLLICHGGFDGNGDNRHSAVSHWHILPATVREYHSELEWKMAENAKLLWTHFVMCCVREPDRNLLNWIGLDCCFISFGISVQWTVNQMTRPIKMVDVRRLFPLVWRWHRFLFFALRPLSGIPILFLCQLICAKEKKKWQNIAFAGAWGMQKNRKLELLESVLVETKFSPRKKVVEKIIDASNDESFKRTNVCEDHWHRFRRRKVVTATRSSWMGFFFYVGGADQWAVWSK